MEERELKAIIEALLFIWGDPLSIEDISNILEIDKKKTEKLLENMIDEFNYTRRGLKIIRVMNTYQLATRAEHHHWISKLFQNNKVKNLSTAALETLSIIAYKQDITKNEIELIRGVRCDKAIETLLSRNLIEEKGRLEKTGRPIIYGTTDEFLRYFGLENLDELPPLEQFKEDEKSKNLEE